MSAPKDVEILAASTYKCGLILNTIFVFFSYIFLKLKYNLEF